ncbi:MAG: hypothetical protein IJM23_05765 [Lachnospiraceae bacterium]|nr:hypothetical protein [Lachnospiraceae bacterium]
MSKNLAFTISECSGKSVYTRGAKYGFERIAEGLAIFIPENGMNMIGIKSGVSTNDLGGRTICVIRTRDTLEMQLHEADMSEGGEELFGSVVGIFETDYHNYHMIIATRNREGKDVHPILVHQMVDGYDDGKSIVKFFVRLINIFIEAGIVDINKCLIGAKNDLVNSLLAKKGEDE